MKAFRVRKYTRSNLVWMSITLTLALAIILLFISEDARGKSENPGKDQPVAVVNGTSIGKDQLYDTLVQLAGKQALEQLITETLLQQEADKQGIAVTEDDIDQELDKIRREYNSPDEYRDKLAQDGFTELSLREQMRTQLLLRKLLSLQIGVTEEQIKAYYEQKKELIASPETVRASHILVKTRAEAEDILKQLRSGADFAELAREKSIDTGTKQSGGDLDFFPRGYLDPNFEKAAFALQTGQISDVVETKQGFHIIKVTDRKAGTNPSYEECKEELRNELIDSQVHNLTGPWLEKLRADASINIIQLQP